MAQKEISAKKKLFISINYINQLYLCLHTHFIFLLATGLPQPLISEAPV